MKRIKRFIQQIRVNLAWHDFMWCDGKDVTLLTRKCQAYVDETTRLVELNEACNGSSVARANRNGGGMA